MLLKHPCCPVLRADPMWLICTGQHAIEADAAGGVVFKLKPSKGAWLFVHILYG